MTAIARRLALLAAACVALLTLPVAAFAAPEAGSLPALTPAQQEQVALAAAAEELALQRVVAIGALDQQADKHAEETAARIAALAAIGFAGDLAHLEHVLPLSGYHRTSHFGATGPLWETVHTGEDFAAPVGTPLVAIGDGVITSVGESGAYGLRTILTLQDGTQLWYCHQSATIVTVGQTVSAGQVLGGVGSSGNTTGPHLHLEVRPGGGAPISPVAWLTALGLTP